MYHAVQAGRSAKLDPVLMNKLEESIPKQLALTAIENGMRENPAGTYELLSSGASLPINDQNGKAIVPSKVFGQKELQGLVTSARIQTSNWQRANFEGMLQDATDPISGLIPEDIIRAKVESGEINVRAGKALMETQDRKQKAEQAAINTESRRQAAEFARDDRDRYNVLQSRIHDSTAWGAVPEEYASELVADAASIDSPALRQQAINAANRQLTAIKKTGALEEKPVEKQIFSQMNEDRMSNDLTVPLTTDVKQGSRLFPYITGKRDPDTITHSRVEGGLEGLRKLTPEEIETKFGKGVTREQVLQSEQVHYANMQEKMRAWFKDPANEKATYEQANAYRMQLEKPYVFQAVKASLTPPPIGAKPTFETGKIYTDAKGNKARFKADGSWETVR